MSESTPCACVTTAIALAEQLRKMIDSPDRSAVKQLAGGLEVELGKIKMEMEKLVQENDALKNHPASPAR